MVLTMIQAGAQRMKKLRPFIVYALVATFISWELYLLVVGHYFDWQWDKSGQFGDSFGALNTLFTGCAFVVVLATLIQQSAQIQETRCDLEKERELQKKTTELLLQQVEALTATARVDALTSRIQAYGVQIEECQDQDAKGRMLKERHTLYLRLDEVLRSHGD